ncbi:GNAT family N-acetyltransferase [Desemzia incerta]|uniref:GNAT family N-acetyltransferase n=1 Tax=Desemzia incerta TaxID=82801 RepID=UPI00166139A1|nr:GNAT family N-acetyltransferase [Desemzia incerta]
MIKFVPVNEKNFKDVINLEITENQKHFVAPNVHSLAECYLYRNNDDVFPYAIQDGNKVVGFLLLDIDDDEKVIMIWRMMIGKQYQGKGYGRATIRKVIQMSKEKNKYTVLIADYVKGNEVMGNLLCSEGFRDYSFNKEDNEYVLHYELK